MHKVTVLYKPELAGGYRKPDEVMIETHAPIDDAYELSLSSIEPDKAQSLLLCHFEPLCPAKQHLVLEKKTIMMDQVAMLHTRAEVLVKSLETTFLGYYVSSPYNPRPELDAPAVVNHINTNNESLEGFIKAMKLNIGRDVFQLSNDYFELLGTMNPRDGTILRPRQVHLPTQLYQQATILGQHSGVIEQCKSRAAMYRNDTPHPHTFFRLSLCKRKLESHDELSHYHA